MSDVQLFDLDGTPISVKDSAARSTATSAASAAAANAQEIANLKALSRLTVAYNSSTETITFTTVQH